MNKLAKGIYLRGSVYWLKFQAGGKRNYISLETTDPMEAVNRALKIRSRPELAPPSAFKTVIDRYLNAKLKQNIYSRATERTTRAVLEEFSSAVGEVGVDTIPENLAKKHYLRLQDRVEETTAQIHIRALRAFFNWCVKEGLSRRNPFGDLKLTKIVRYARLKWASQEQRDKLIAEAPTDDLRFILFCGFHTGMRKNEIIESRVNWFNLSENGSVYIQNTDTFTIKDREARHIPLTKEFRAFLQGYLGGSPGEAYALRNDVKHGKGVYRYDFHRPFNDYMVAQGMRWCTAHVMRHTLASLAVQAGISIFKVARWLGDGVEVVEKHYAHLAPHDSDIERMMVR